MRRIVQVGLVATLCSLTLSPITAVAQERCVEGKTASGTCVNALLGAAARQIAVIFSQPKISKTAYPVLPSGDRKYRYPNQLIPDPLRPAPCCGPPIP
jgi:hypothetical protein